MKEVTSNEKKSNVPLEEALNIAGTGMYTSYVIFSVGFLLFAGMLNVEAMAMVLPAAGCDLQLKSWEKGILASMTLGGMLVTGPFPGFLSDAYGRKRICLWGQIGGLFLMVLCSIAPSTLTLMISCFLTGISLTGAFTPAYVLVGEFSPMSIRGRAIVISTTVALVSNIVLPGLAWLVMPLEVKLPVFHIFTFTSWRLFLIILTIPNFIALLLLWRIPETPKFLLNNGNHEETMIVLQKIYAVNMKKKTEDYPVLSVVLDSSDEGYGENFHIKNPVLKSAADMISRTRLLFSKNFVFTTLITCVLFFTDIGVFYIFTLWFPEQTSRIKQYANHHDVYNVTICYLMSSKNDVEDDGNCELNYDFFMYGLILGVVQVICGATVSAYADKASKKLLLACVLVASAILSTILVFITEQYSTIAVLGISAIITGIGFPLVLALVMERYPTYVRSTASAVGIIFGRLGATGGNQLMGVLYDNYCNHAYFGITGLLIATAILCMILPSRKIS